MSAAHDECNAALARQVQNAKSAGAMADKLLTQRDALREALSDLVAWHKGPGSKVTRDTLLANARAALATPPAGTKETNE